MKTIKVLFVEDQEYLINNYITAFSLVKKYEGTAEYVITHVNTAFEAQALLENSRVTSPFNLVILDIGVSLLDKESSPSKEDIGLQLRKEFPNTKLIISTLFKDYIKVCQLEDKFDPDGIILSRAIEDLSEVAFVIYKVLHCPRNAKNRKLAILGHKVTKPYLLTKFDRQTLFYLNEGLTLKELAVEVSTSEVELNNSLENLFGAFYIESRSIRDLLLVAKSMGFVYDE